MFAFCDFHTHTDTLSLSLTDYLPTPTPLPLPPSFSLSNQAHTKASQSPSPEKASALNKANQNAVSAKASNLDPLLANVKTLHGALCEGVRECMCVFVTHTRTQGRGSTLKTWPRE